MGSGLKFLGISMLILGVLGLFLPVLQGILFLAVGTLVLSKDWPWLDEKIQKRRQKHQKLHDILERAENYIENKFDRKK